MIIVFVVSLAIIPFFSASAIDFSPWMGTSGLSTEESPALITGTVISLVLTFVGLIFLILIIYSGFTLAFAGGSEEKVSKARKIITSAVIGLLITLSAYGIGFLVFSKLPGVGGGGGAGTCNSVGGECTSGSCHFSEKNYGSRNCSEGKTCCGEKENGCTDKGGHCETGCETLGGYCESTYYCDPAYPDKNYLEGCPSGSVCCTIEGAYRLCSDGTEPKGWQGCGNEQKCCDMYP